MPDVEPLSTARLPAAASVEADWSSQRGGLKMKRTLLGWIAAAAIIGLGAAGTTGAATYPPPKPEDVATPFSGMSVPRAWLGLWRVRGGDDDGVVWRFLGRTSRACAVYTLGRVSCFLISPPGQSENWAGAITLANGRLVLRMTYRPRPNTFGCFADDVYSYRLKARRLTIVSGTDHSCFWEPTAHFPIRLDRIRR
jgi:hypothetical protein